MVLQFTIQPTGELMIYQEVVAASATIKSLGTDFYLLRKQNHSLIHAYISLCASKYA